MGDSPGSIRAGQGAVEVTGTARVAERTFASPLTERECVAYRFEKEAKLPSATRDRNDGESRRHTWQTIHVEEAGAPFYVEDGGERVLVDGSTADLDVEQSYVVETSDFEEGVGETVTVRGEAVAPEGTPVGSSLDAGVSGPTEPASDGLVGTVKGAIGVADEVPADPRARYKPRAIERLPTPDADDADGAADDERAREVRDTVSMFEGVPQGHLSENPDAVQRMIEEVEAMTEEELRVADGAMPDAPALEAAQVVVSWGQGSEFVVSDSA